MMIKQLNADRYGDDFPLASIPKLSSNGIPGIILHNNYSKILEAIELALELLYETKLTEKDFSHLSNLGQLKACAEKREAISSLQQARYYVLDVLNGVTAQLS